jgi:hypothetical protein
MSRWIPSLQSEIIAFQSMLITLIHLIVKLQKINTLYNDDEINIPKTFDLQIGSQRIYQLFSSRFIALHPLSLPDEGSKVLEISMWRTKY